MSTCIHDIESKLSLFKVRNLLVMSSVFSLFGGCALFIVSSLLLVSLRANSKSSCTFHLKELLAQVVE